MHDSLEDEQEIMVVRPRGRLSLREGHDLLASIFEEVNLRPRDVIVDLDGVEDMSSWGFALMCGLARKLATMGRRLRIARPTPFVRKYLELFTGLKQPMDFHCSREDAVRAARSRRTNGRRGV